MGRHSKDLQTYISCRMELHTTSPKPVKSVSSDRKCARPRSCLRGNGASGRPADTPLSWISHLPLQRRLLPLSRRFSYEGECRFFASTDAGTRYFSDCNVARESPEVRPFRADGICWKVRNIDFPEGSRPSSFWPPATKPSLAHRVHRSPLG